MTDTLTIQLLGGFQIRNSDGPLAGFTSARLQSVLTYLILSRNTPQSRQQLAYLFWPESSDQQARTNLRNSLHLLRTHLPDADAFLQVDSLTVQWRPDAPAEIDVAHFDVAMAAAQRTNDTVTQKAALERAVTAYVGDLLPACYDEWILSVREEWQQRYISAVEQLIDLLNQLREYRPALEHAQRLLQYDPLLETTYGRLMELHAAQGDRAAALRVYHLCRTTLAQELGVDPSPTTQAIYERLLNLETPIAPVAPTSIAAPLAATPLIGREMAWATLQQCWQQVMQRSGTGPAVQLVMLEGEAGIGKTRLMQELLEATSRQGTATATAYCYPAGGRLAYAPLQNWLRAPEIARHRETLAPLWQQELGRLLPELVDASQVFADPSPMTDNAHRRRLFEAVLQALSATQAPLILAIDDIQWCDSDSLEWIEFLLRSQVQQPILLIATLRSGENTPDDALTAFRHRTERTGDLHEIELPRLTQEETGQLVANLTGNPLEAIDLPSIFAETEGNPLFIVETVRAGWQQTESRQRNEAQSATASTHSLPAKIQSVIEGRLVRLSPEARAIADVAAVVGRAFTPMLLTAATDTAEDDLIQGLDELWQQQIIREHAGRLDDAYDFAHDKVREVVYNVLSPMRRRLLHRRVAAALETLNTAGTNDISAQIALHHEQAGQRSVAVQWLLRAAQAAHRLSALQDALAYLAQALELLGSLGDGLQDQEVGALELPIQMQRGALLLATKGYAAPEVEQALTRALALCVAGGTPVQRFAVLWGLSRYYLVRPDLDKGWDVAQQLSQMAEVSQSPELRLVAYTAAGTYLLHQAKLTDALDYFDQVITLYDQTAHGNHTVTYGQDHGVVSLSYSAWTCWCLGQTEEAKSRTERAIQLADALGYPYNQVIAQTYAAAQSQYAGDAAACLPHATAASEQATAQGFILWQAMADFMRGWAHAHLGEAEKGIALMTASTNLFQATGAELGACYLAALLAETLGEQGQLAPALAAIDEAFVLLERTQDRWCAAELHRIHGELLLLQASDEETSTSQVQSAKAALTTGLHIAQEQGAAWWVARCEESLAQLHQ